VIATNTTLSRPAGLERSEQGGLSGAPLLDLSRNAIQHLKVQAKNRLVVIAAGGIASAEDARGSLEAGADLVQVYSGLIYRGPALVREIRDAL
jgi:dihydroorotate dehydrogenase